MTFPHILLAVLVAFIWGVNFLFVKMGLDEVSPLFLCALRFVFASIPAVLFIKPPAIPFRVIIQYGLIMFVLQSLRAREGRRQRRVVRDSPRFF